MMLAQAAAVVRDTIRIVDTLRLVRVDTVWVAQPASGFVEIATAWSTVAVAALAVFALGRELWQARQKRFAMDAQITSVAYSVQRQLKSWLEPPDELSIGWASNLARRDDGPSHFDIAEKRFEQLMQDAPFASKVPREAIYRAFVLFNVATLRINENLEAFQRFNKPDFAPLHVALGEFEQCIAALNGAIDEGLRNEEAKLLKPPARGA